MPVPYLACMLMTAHFYALPPRVLPSIARVEGGSAGLVHRNNDGTADLGVMQINTLWVPLIAKVTNQNPAFTTARLIHDPCFSIAAGGAILKAYLTETSGNLMLAIGDYHSHTRSLNLAYSAKVLTAANTLFGPAGG